MHVLAAVVVIENLLSLWEMLAEDIPDPARAVANKGEPYAIVWDPSSDEAHCLRELLLVANLVPAGDVHDSLSPTEQVQANAFGFTPHTWSPFLLAPSLRPGGRMSPIT